MARHVRQVFLALLVPASLYAGLCLLVFLTQRSQIYYPVRESAAPGATPMLFARDGAEIKVWTVERPGPAALLYFGGNAEDVGASIGLFARRLPNHSLYFVNYRGYGGSTGRPSEDALVRDAVALYDHVRATHSEVSVVGRSLGSGVAVQLASGRDVSRLALVTPFDSLVNVARPTSSGFPSGCSCWIASIRQGRRRQLRRTCSSSLRRRTRSFRAAGAMRSSTHSGPGRESSCSRAHGTTTSTWIRATSTRSRPSSKVEPYDG